MSDELRAEHLKPGGLPPAPVHELMYEQARLARAQADELEARRAVDDAAVTLTLTLAEAHAVRARLLPESGSPRVERAKAKLEVAIDRVTLAASALTTDELESDVPHPTPGH